MMRLYSSLFKEMFSDDRAAVLIEYALTMALISVVGFTGFFAVSLAVSKMYSSDTNGMQNMNNQLWQPLP